MFDVACGPTLVKLRVMHTLLEHLPKVRMLVTLLSIRYLKNGMGDDFN